MQRDERLDEDAEIMGQTLLEKIRAEDKTAALTMEQKERKLQSKQRKMRKFVKQSLQSVEERILEASPKKIGATGNVVLDRINRQVT